MPTTYAIQCRITSEDPELNFQPDSGRIQVSTRAHSQLSAEKSKHAEVLHSAIDLPLTTL